MPDNRSQQRTETDEPMRRTERPHGHSVMPTFEAALDDHLEALCARDVNPFAVTLGDDATTIDGSGTITRGTEAVLRSHAEWFAVPERWRFDYDIVFTRETEYSGLALLDVRYRHTPADEPSRFLLSLVFERDATGAFKFVYDQNTPLPG